MHVNSRSIMGWFKNSYLDEDSPLKILDVGSLDVKGDYNYRTLFNSSNWVYEGLDIKMGNNVDIVVDDIYNWFEIEDNSYDVVISGQFLQNLEFFWLTVSQMERVLKPGGYLCIIAPSGGGNYNKDLPFCYKFREGALKGVARYVGLDILRVGCDGRPKAEPWCDSYLFAKKPGKSTMGDNSIEDRMDALENKLDAILNKIK